MVKECKTFVPSKYKSTCETGRGYMCGTRIFPVDAQICTSKTQGHSWKFHVPLPLLVAHVLLISRRR